MLGKLIVGVLREVGTRLEWAGLGGTGLQLDKATKSFILSVCQTLVFDKR